MRRIRNVFVDRRGATAIEYGLIAALIAVAAITAMGNLGNQLKTVFGTTTTKMADGVTRSRS